MNAISIPRRLLLGSAVGALALRPSRTAQADTTFTNFGFAATGAPALRTMPDRLSDIVNVKDWGAAGTGGDYTTAISNAITHCISNGGGTVYFPPGTYKTHNLSIGSNTFDVGVILQGAGKDCTLLYAIDNTAVLLSGGGLTYDCLERVEFLSVFSSSGSIKVSRPCTSIVGVRTGGIIGIDTIAGNGCLITDCALSGPGGNRADRVPYHSPAPGSIGIALGSGCAVRNTRIQGGYDIAYALSGRGASVIGCAAEVHNTAVRVGWSPSGETLARGCSVIDVQTERCFTGLDLYYCEGCFIAANNPEGNIGTPDAAPIANMTWAAGVVTVTTPTPHNIPLGPNRKLQIRDPNPGGYSPPGVAGGLILANVIDTTHFTYPLASNPGRFVSSNGWNYPIQYAVRCRKVYETVIQGNSWHVVASEASIDLDHNGEAQHRNNLISGSIGSWKLPSNKRNLSGWRFINCSGTAGVYGDNFANPYGQMVFANLPGQSGVFQDGPIEGQEYDIIDGQKSGGGSAAFADIVAGGGSGHYKVRYDGSNWRRIG
jgi:Pectate lyase superfamily protein